MIFRILHLLLVTGAYLIAISYVLYRMLQAFPGKKRWGKAATWLGVVMSVFFIVVLFLRLFNLRSWYLPFQTVAYLWMIFVLYAFLMTLLFTCFRVVIYRIPPLRVRLSRHLQATRRGYALASFLLIFGLIIYGLYHFTQPKVVELTLEVDKPVPDWKIVAVSDLHLGTMSSEQLNRHIDTINALRPDMVLLLGDQFVINWRDFTPMGYTNAFRRLHPPKGIYAIHGNHEFKNKKNLVHFFDGITGLMQVLIFFLLGFLATPSMLPKSILPALDIFLFLTLIARPASVVAILTPFRKYPFRQQMLISFVGLRGAASIVFAIVASAGIESLQHDFFNIVFCLVLISISVQGSLIPTVAKRLKMIDTKNDVMKTFNDYNENSEMQFGRIDISADSTWNGRAIRDIDIPKSALIVMIVRGKERILPRGHTVLMEGDQVITIMKHFEDNYTHLVEKTVKPDSRRVGHKLSEFAGNGLIVMIQRGEESIIPNGDTILYAGDRLILFDMTRTGENVRNG